MIGMIERLQVQRKSLKRMVGKNKLYFTDDLLSVKKMRLTPDGVTGLMLDGSEVLDVHHPDHPDSRNNAGRNGISIGFTAHYAAMREKFGDHLQDGCAGENIVVGCRIPYTLEELAGTIIVVRPGGGEVARIEVVSAMAPCDPFSHYVHKSRRRLPPLVLKETLQFLSDGRRGYLVALHQPSEVVFQVGDELYLF